MHLSIEFDLNGLKFNATDIKPELWNKKTQEN